MSVRFEEFVGARRVWRRTCVVGVECARIGRVCSHASNEAGGCQLCWSHGAAHQDQRTRCCARLALRIGAVKHAIEGADFVEVFRCFLRAGQSEEESARSTMRVFRGGDPRGKVAFIKDVVYLHGLIACTRSCGARSPTGASS